LALQNKRKILITGLRGYAEIKMRMGEVENWLLGTWYLLLGKRTKKNLTADCGWWLVKKWNMEKDNRTGENVPDTVSFSPDCTDF